MKISTEALEERQVRLVIELDEEQTQTAMRQAARQIAKQVNIPGFRKGKAPYNVVVQRFGEDVIRKEGADMIAEATYREALEQAEIDPYAPGMLEDISYDPITFTLTVPLTPTVEIEDYRSYRLPYQEVEIDPVDVEKALQDIRDENAVFETVERPAEMGDGVAIDLEALSLDGEELLKGEDIRLILEAGSSDPAPGFAEELVGMSAGEEKGFSLTLTDEYPREEFRGQEAKFTVTMNEVYKSILPELDDDLARTVGKYDSLKELEEAVEERLRATAQREADAEYAEQVIEAIVEQAQVEYPPAALHDEVDAMVKELERSLQRNAKLSLDDYLRVQGKTTEELRADFEPGAAARLKRALVLGEIVQREGLDVKPEELNAQIDEMSAPWGVRADKVRESLNTSQARFAMLNRLLANKAVERLVTIAKGEYVEPAAEDDEGIPAETEQVDEETQE
ncbi:MAG: trigger factor [Chloroflexi bacterium]|nr:trigger factor [Chloroflexota bacterium]